MRNTTSKVMLAIVAAVMAGTIITGCGSEDVPPAAGTTASENAPATLPERVPADFPLAEGTLVTGTETGDAAWSVAVSVEDAAAQQKALDDLLAAGFTEHGSEQSDPKARTFSLNDGVDAVTLGLTQTGDQFLVSYSFAPIVG